MNRIAEVGDLAGRNAKIARTMIADQQQQIELRRLVADDWRIWRRLRQAALEEAPDAFSSSLADWTGPGDSEDRWRARLTAVPFNLAAYLGASEAGMVSGSTWVTALPSCSRCGSRRSPAVAEWVTPWSMQWWCGPGTLVRLA